jgi:hypothetical protein
MPPKNSVFPWALQQIGKECLSYGTRGVIDAIWW